MNVKIITLGCKVNIYESEFVTNLLIDHGYKIVMDNPDIIIINTCTVTNTSDQKSRKFIHQARREYPNAIIIVMGCYSQIKYENLRDMGIDIVIGNKDKSKIIELINEYKEKHQRIEKIYDLDNQDFEKMEIRKFNSHTRAFVKIQDGCDAFCSYCIIPYARGSIRSKDINDVISEIKELVSMGYKEIILSGIHTGKYGRDKDYNFYDLLLKISEIKDLYRVRISSIEINELTDEIIELMKNNPLFARHLHIPLQTGSDKILMLMNRKYDTKYFFERINYIRKNIPDISITTDLIVGFPHESDLDFKDTLSFLDKIKFTKIHVFPYSPRVNTKAALMDEQIPGDIKKKRVHEVIELSNREEVNYSSLFINKTLEVLTEDNDSLETIAITSNYLKVKVKGVFPSNKILLVKVISNKDEILYGELND